MKILPWNVKGLGAVAKNTSVKMMALSRKPDVLFLQETKVQEVEKRMVTAVWGGGSMGWLVKASQGASGLREVLVCCYHKLERIQLSISFIGFSVSWVLRVANLAPDDLARLGLHMLACFVMIRM